jgi:predicted secreted hydrolase
MMPRVRFRALVLALLFVMPFASAASGQDFQPALPGYDFEFPRDHGTHDDYRTEWWYYTGHLYADHGKRYGFELTFFRVGIVPPSVPVTSRWDLRNLSLAHFAITDVNGKRFRYYEKLNRTSPFTAGAAAGYLDVFNESWSARTRGDGAWQLSARAGGDVLALTLRARKAPAIHGENGISVKAEGVGYASHYYSMTRLDVAGSINGATCHGSAWMDHEFGSSALRESQQGWDWFSIQFDDDSELMVYIIRRSDGTADASSSGSFIAPNGRIIHLRRDQLRIDATGSWTSPHTRAKYPMGWRINVPALGISATLTPLLNDQELVTRASTGVTYWEGAVDVNGTFGNTSVSGDGYVEMTGYDRAFRAP